MGRRCCCNPACKICNCNLGTSVPEEAKVYDFTHSKFTLSGFQDWSYDYTYSNSFGTYTDAAAFSYIGYDPTDVYYDYNRIRYHNLFHGNGSVRYKVSITGLSLLNGEHDFNKSDNCRFDPSEYSTYLGEVVAESFVEINATGNIYTFFVVPPYYGQSNFLPGLYCSSTSFGCPFYRPRFYSAIIPPDWSGTLGTRIKFDVYAYRNSYFPVGFNNCAQHAPEISFKFIIKETEPITTGVFNNYGKLLLSSSVEADCSNYNSFGCPTNTCEWTTGRGSWSTCKDPFDNVLFGYDVVQRTFQYDSCWWRCVRYENHTNFSPIPTMSDLGRTKPDMFFLLNTSLCGNLFYTLNASIDNTSYVNTICENWNGANQTISDDYPMTVDFSSLDVDPTLIDNTTKIHAPCGQNCGISGTGIGFSENYFFLQNIFDYLFNYNTVFPYDPPGIANNPLVFKSNYQVRVPKLFWAEWGSFTLATYNGYALPDPTIPPSGLYQCSFTKPDIPTIPWSLVSNSIHSAKLIKISSEDPYFVLPPPLQIEVSVLYD